MPRDHDLAIAREVIRDVLDQVGDTRSEWQVREGYEQGFGGVGPVIELVRAEGTRLQFWPETDEWYWLRWLGPEIGEMCVKWFLRKARRDRRLVDVMVPLMQGSFQVEDRVLTVGSDVTAMEFPLVTGPVTETSTRVEPSPPQSAVVEELARMLGGEALDEYTVAFTDLGGRQVVGYVPAGMVKALERHGPGVLEVAPGPLPHAIAWMLVIYAQEVEPSFEKYPTRYRIRGLRSHFVVEDW